MQITVISGTNRAGSVTRALSGHIAAIHEQLGAQVSLLDLGDLPPAIFTPAAYAEKPADFVHAFTDPVLRSDGLVVVTPEYNGSFPGVLKLFIDHLPFPEAFDNRPVSFVGIAAGQFGALRPVEHLQQIFGYRNAHVYPRRVFIAYAGKALGADGEPLEAGLRDRLGQQAQAFQEYVGALRATR
jgi:NAD(P)H-dependent FMN reductase